MNAFVLTTNIFFDAEASKINYDLRIAFNGILSQANITVPVEPTALTVDINYLITAAVKEYAANTYNTELATSDIVINNQRQ